MSKNLHISTGSESGCDSKNRKISPRRSKGFSHGKVLIQSPYQILKVGDATFTSAAVELDVDLQCRGNCVDTTSVKSIIDSIVNNHEGLSNYAVNSGASVGLFAYNATVFTSPSFRDHSYKSTASLSDSFFYSSGQELVHSSSPTVDRKEGRSTVVPSSNHSSPTIHRNSNIQSILSFPPPSSSPLAAGASRLPSSLPLNTTVDYSRHLARSSNTPEEQAGPAQWDGDEDRDNEEDNDGGNENPPTEATVQPTQREQGQQLLAPALSAASKHPSVASPSVPPHVTGFERLEIDDSSTNGRQSHSRFEAPWRRSKGKSANRRSRRSSATTNRLPRSSRGLRQRGQRANSFFVRLYVRIRTWLTPATPTDGFAAALTSIRGSGWSTAGDRTQPNTPSSPYALFSPVTWENQIAYVHYHKSGD